MGVVAVHAAIVYGVDGSFYLEDYDSMAGVSVGFLTLAVGVGFLFGLGAFFLIAGRLSGPSLDRKGPGRFVRDRLVRRGIPIIFYVVAIAPVMEYVKYRDEGGARGFLSFAWDQRSDPAPGPTWFIEALLAFSLAYALVRALRPARGRVSRDPLRGRQVLAVAAAAGSRAPSQCSRSRCCCSAAASPRVTRSGTSTREAGTGRRPAPRSLRPVLPPPCPWS